MTYTTEAINAGSIWAIHPYTQWCIRGRNGARLVNRAGTDCRRFDSLEAALTETARLNSLAQGS